MKQAVAVVILNWNGLDLLKEFLPEVAKYSKKANVYVADNASTDASVEFVHSHFPNIKIIQNKVNGGYAKGYNDALAGLTEDIFILLNSDVKVTPNWLLPILKIFKKDENIAAIQPKILDYKKPTHFEYAGAAGGFIDKIGYPYCRGRIFDHLEEDTGQYDDEIEIFWASGACLAIKRDKYLEVGKLDEDYFAHQEEIDICWRLYNHGYKVVYTPDSVIYHMGGATLNSMNPKKTFLNFRNSLFNLIKNVPSNKIISVLFLRMVLDGIAAFKFLFELKFSHFLAVFQAHMSFYMQLNKFLKKRKKLPQKENYYTKISVVCRNYGLGQKKFSDL
ncbi:glycosyltransferase family 2 protein [Gillisia sp. CAL575]|uniref:glycosyltransferase family 2 protein n=1 Tax=Gillisia sp. CAL575 TaxID=985255 RepID=UPI0003A6E2CA|nr:glycosyltransferase family 2 protein [Gillisia sp. CAL575]